jgi:hypothetical protein
MQTAVRASAGAQPDIRVGLHAGEVVVRAIHADLSVDYDAIGPTVHLAARMEQMAEAGSTYCTSQVVRLAEGLIVTRPLGSVSVKGFREPLELFEITGHTVARTRWEVTAARRVCRSAQISFLIPVLSTSLGYAYAAAGRTDEGLGLLSKALEFQRQPNSNTVLCGRRRILDLPS